METGLVTVESQSLVPTSPQQQVERASVAAKVLKDVVTKAHLSKSFGGQKEHLYFEAWLTIAAFYHSTPKTEWTKEIKEEGKIIGYEAKVSVVTEDGRVIGSAEGMCLKDEANWRNKPLYAIKSMAQTRTAAKALRSVYSWVVVLAGYSATPAEEMQEDFVQRDQDDIPKFKPPETPKKHEGGAPGPMSDKQRKMLWAKMKEAGLSNTESKDMFGWYSGSAELNMKEASDFITNFDSALESFQKSSKKDANMVPEGM